MGLKAKCNNCKKCYFRRSNSQIGNWEQQNARSPSLGRSSEWSDSRRSPSLQHQESIESRLSKDPSPKNVGNKVGSTNQDSDELLQIKRRQWEESTAKRIHVVVRARPLNIREIKSDCRVTKLFFNGRLFKFENILKSKTF